MGDSDYILDQELKDAVQSGNEQHYQTARDNDHRRRQQLRAVLTVYIIGAKSFPAQLVTKIFTRYPQFLTYGNQTGATRAVYMSKIFLGRDPKDIFGVYHRLQRETLELLPYSVVVTLDRAKDAVQHALTDAVGRDFASYVAAFL